MSASPFGGRLVFWGITGCFCLSVFSNLVLCIFGDISAEITDSVLIVSMIAGGLAGAVSAAVYGHYHPEAKSNLIKEFFIIIGINLLSAIILILEDKFL